MESSKICPPSPWSDLDYDKRKIALNFLKKTLLRQFLLAAMRSLPKHNYLKSKPRIFG